MVVTSYFLWYRSDSLGFSESCWSRNSPIHKIAGHADVCSTALVWLIIVRCVSYLGNLPEILPMVRTPFRTMLQIQILCFPELTSPLDSLPSVSITYNISSKMSSVFVNILLFLQSVPRQMSKLHKLPGHAANRGCGSVGPGPFQAERRAHRAGNF